MSQSLRISRIANVAIWLAKCPIFVDMVGDMLLKKEESHRIRKHKRHTKKEKFMNVYSEWNAFFVQ